jgi:hypothetical protein
VLQWISQHLFALVSTAIAFLSLIIGWLEYKKKALVKRTTAVASGTGNASAAINGSHNIQRINSDDFHISAPNASGQDTARYHEWRELRDELRAAFDQIRYAFEAISQIDPANDTNSYESGIRRGENAIRNRMIIGDVLRREKILERYRELVEWVLSTRRNGESFYVSDYVAQEKFDKLRREFETDLMRIAEQDLCLTQAAPGWS